MVTPGQYGADLTFSEDADAAQAFMKHAQQQVAQTHQQHMHQFQTLPSANYMEPEDEIEHTSNRGEMYSDLVSCLINPMLRFGFLGQLIALVSILAVYYGQGGKGIFSFDLFNMPEKLRTSEGFSMVLLTIQGAYLFACLLIAGFQAFVSDNSKMSRGFRAGSKILGGAVILDIVVVALRLLQYTYAYHFLGSKWWLKYAQTKSDWCLFYAGASFNGVALILYGLAIFYMETYHDDGTFEEVAWATLGLFGLAGAFEILMVFTGFGTFYTIFQLAAVVSATIWAFSFEPLLHFFSPSLHDRDVNENVFPPGSEE